MEIRQLIQQGARDHAEGRSCPHTDQTKVQWWAGGKWQAERAQGLIAEGLDLSRADQFVVGFNEDGSFSTLGHRSSYDGRGLLTSYGKRVTCIRRVEDFDPRAWQHAEFVPFYAAALRKLSAAGSAP